MTLTPVESSNLAAIGYLDAEHTCLVRFRDGTLTALHDMSAATFAEFLSAPSKGGWLHAHSKEFVSIFIRKGGNAEDSQSKERAAPLAAETSGPLPPSAPISIADMRKQQKPTSAADCAFAVVK